MSLFRRMAAVGRGAEVGDDSERESRGELSERTEPRMSEPQPPAPALEPEATTEPQDRQTSLKPQDESDLLDIPSFLRRQAN